MQVENIGQVPDHRNGGQKTTYLPSTYFLIHATPNITRSNCDTQPMLIALLPAGGERKPRHLFFRFHYASNTISRL